MTWLLMKAGWTAYQASCLAPVFWILLAAGVIYVATSLADGEEPDDEED